jgi:hypothetical protein
MWRVVAIARVFGTALAIAAACTSANVRGETDFDSDVSGIAITVLDAKSNRPIPEFRVLAGIRAGAVAREFEERTGKEVVNWQPHTLRVGTDGHLLWPLARAYDEMALRVEADGFAPLKRSWIKKADGPRRLVLHLREDPGIRGRVLQPDGKPAAGATLALAMPQKDAVLENGRLRGKDEPLPENAGDRWRRPVIVEANVDGEFRLPTENDAAAAVLVTHDSGAAEMPYAELAKSAEVILRPWGRVEGRVLWKDKPGTDEPVGLTIHRDEYGYPGTIAQYGETKTGADGKFVFTRVLPGRAQISRWVVAAEPNASATRSSVFPGLYVHVEIQPGDTTPVLIGGQGRKVTGRLIGHEKWGGVTFHFYPAAPHIGFVDEEDDDWKAFGRFGGSPIGPLFFRGKLKPNADGTFEIPHLLPGRYQLFVDAPGIVGSRLVEIEPEKDGEPPGGVDLGEIRVGVK